jgi:glycosyltransferase involved in cell wall biosynthesis
MSPIRVLHAITMLELGGAQRNTLDTVARLDRSRFAVGLACAEHGVLLEEARSIPNATLFELPHLKREVDPGADLRAVGELRRAIRAFQPHIVHTHSSKAGVLGRLAARREGVPRVVHSIHGFGFGAHQLAPVRAAFLAAERLAAPWTDAFIAVSRRNAADGVALGLFEPHQVRVIRSGIDLAAFRAPAGGAALRRELGIPESAPVVVQVSCFKPQKAPERFVLAAAQVRMRCPDAHFVLVGDGKLRPQLERLRRQLGLEGRLHLPGWRRDVPAVFAAARVATLTSRFEGLPRVVVEALAAGVPVVAMAVEGVEEVLRPGIDGFLVGEGDVAALAEKVSLLLCNGQLHRAMAGRAGETVGEWDRDTMVRQQEELYEELLWQRRN